MTARITRLTARQLQVVALGWQGLTHEQIGRRLGIATDTSNKHAWQAYERMGLGLGVCGDSRTILAVRLWRECAARSGGTGASGPG